jgi:hypothetical protein
MHPEHQKAGSIEHAARDIERPAIITWLWKSSHHAHFF